MAKRKIASALCLLFACSTKPAPKQTQTATGPATSKAPATSPNPAPKPPASLPQSAPQSAPQTVVLFAGPKGEGWLLPGGCYDATKKAFLERDACLSLVAVGTQVAYDNGGVAKITEKGKESLCGIEDEVQEAIKVEGTTKGGAFALWPESAVAMLRKVPAPGDLNSSLGADESARLEAAVRKNAPGPVARFVLRQRVLLDLDGDSKDDILYSVHAEKAPQPGDNAPGGTYSWDTSSDGLYFSTAAKPESVEPLSSAVSFEILAVSDLDQDKRAEVILSTEYYEGGGISLNRLEAQKWVQLKPLNCP